MRDHTFAARQSDHAKDPPVVESQGVDDLFLRADVPLAFHVETLTVSFQVCEPDVPVRTVAPVATAANGVV